MMWFAVGGAVWLMVAAFMWALCKAASRADEQMERAVALAERREVGYCGSCGGPVMLDPQTGVAVCPYGDCRLPWRLVARGRHGS